MTSTLTAANDNRPARTLADQLAFVLEARNRPDHDPEPVQSNWLVEPSQVAVEPEIRRDLHGEQYLRVTPSLDEIYREMHKPAERNDAGQIVAIGKLKFSDGTQTEKAFTIGPDGDVIQFDRRMPTGAMLGCEERLTDSAGGAVAKVAIGGAELARRFDVEHVEYIPGGQKRKGRSYSAEESRELIAAAVANTAVMPEVTKCPPGMANGTAQVSDCFIGMKVGSTGKGGASSWQDTCVAIEDHAAWRKAHDALSETDKSVLLGAMTARSLADLGDGGHRRTRERQAVRRLVAANDNLVAAVRKFG